MPVESLDKKALSKAASELQVSGQESFDNLCKNLKVAYIVLLSSDRRGLPMRLRRIVELARAMGLLVAKDLQKAEDNFYNCLSSDLSRHVKRSTGLGPVFVRPARDRARGVVGWCGLLSAKRNFPADWDAALKAIQLEKANGRNQHHSTHPPACVKKARSTVSHTTNRQSSASSKGTMASSPSLYTPALKMGTGTAGDLHLLADAALQLTSDAPDSHCPSSLPALPTPLYQPWPVPATRESNDHRPYSFNRPVLPILLPAAQGLMHHLSITQGAPFPQTALLPDAAIVTNPVVAANAALAAAPAVAANAAMATPDPSSVAMLQLAAALAW